VSELEANQHPVIGQCVVCHEPGHHTCRGMFPVGVRDRDGTMVIGPFPGEVTFHLCDEHVELISPRIGPEPRDVGEAMEEEWDSFARKMGFNPK
jgi:hypothetical protein